MYVWIDICRMFDKLSIFSAPYLYEQTAIVM